MTKAADTLATPDPSGDIHQSRVDAADAPILALGAEFRAHVAETHADWSRANALDESGEPDARKQARAIYDACSERSGEYHRLLNAMRDIPAHTVAGMAAKADAVLHWLSPGGTEIPDDHEDGRVAWSLARDVLRLASEGPNPDAELIATCAEFDRLEYGHLRLYYGATKRSTDEERDAADDASGRAEQQGDLVKKIYATRATTLEGWRAKARSAATWDLELLGSGSGNESEVILASLVRDLIGDHDPIAVINAEDAA